MRSGYTNILEELNEFLAEHSVTLVAAELSLEKTYDEKDHIKLWYRDNIPNTFFDDIAKLGYDRGYGGQELFGTLWFSDGTWADRGEYDGSEWWEHRKRPAIPLIGISKDVIGE